MKVFRIPLDKSWDFTRLIVIIVIVIVAVVVVIAVAVSRLAGSSGVCCAGEEMH